MEDRASILVVEDSATQSEQLRHVLAAAYPHLETRATRNGKEALSAVRSKPPVLIISDIVMPVMDGYALCSALKADSRHKHIPIILLTSLSDPEDIVRGLNAGTDYYLTKPYEEDFLLQKISAIIEHPHGPQTAGESGWKVVIAGREHVVRADLQQMLNLLLSTYENAVQQNRKLLALQDKLRRVNESLEERVRERTVELSKMNQQLTLEIGERKRIAEQLQLQLSRMDALRHIDAAITGSLDLRVTLNVLLDQVISQLGVDAADVLLFKSPHSRLEFAASRGFKTPGRVLAAHDFSKGPAGQAVRERTMVRIDGLRASGEKPLPAEMVEAESFSAYMATPLVAKGRVEGVLEIYGRHALSEDDEWLGFLETLARQAAIAIDSALLFEGLQRSNSNLLDAYETTLEGWSKALDLRDKETEGHSIRVTQMTELLASKLGVNGADLTHVRRGSLLHDIGKLGVPDTILRKPGPLTAEERALMEKHPVYAYEWLSSIAFIRPAIDIPYCHHEKWDGTGYPQGLSMRQIPLAARIFALADIWDALRSDRPYRRSWSRAACLAHVTGLRGTHLDPEVVDAFLQLYGELGAGIDSLPGATDGGPA